MVAPGQWGNQSMTGPGREAKVLHVQPALPPGPLRNRMLAIDALAQDLARGATRHAESINDRRKLLAHRLVARLLPDHLEIITAGRAMVAGWQHTDPAPAFIGEWALLLSGSVADIRAQIVSRDPEMKRLRLTSPFYLCVPELRDPAIRQRLQILARRGIDLPPVQVIRRDSSSA